MGRSFDAVHSELRYNLATKVMSNGVEVIVATERADKPLEPEYLRLLSSTVTRPITLAPHTLTNLMSMVLSSEQITNDPNDFMAFLQPSFTLNTYYTTYNYKTTTFKNNATAVSNAITTITNIKTEPFSNEEIKPTKSLSYAFDGSPTLRTEVFDTEYTYFNTILDGDQPLVVSSTHTISNTLVGNNFAELEPSEVFPTTNTYLKTVELTKTITDGTDRHIVSTTDVVTRVVVTDKPTRKSTTALTTTTNVTKTYFVTYTYFSTFVDGDKTKVKSDVSVSSDVAVEKFYIKPKKTDSKTLEKVTRTEDPGLEATALNFPFNILATKTYMTTFTYYTTLLHGTNSEVKINSRTKIKEKVVAETIPQQEFNTNYLIKLNSSLQKISGSLVGTATLKGGETILVTAYKNPSLKHSYQKYEIKPTKTIFEGPLNTERNQIDATQKASSKKDAGEKTSSSTANSKITLIKSSKTANNQPIAEPLIADEEEESSILMTPVATIAPTTSHTVGQSNPTKAQSFHEKATVSSAGVQNDVERETDSPTSLPEPSENKPEQKPKPVNQTNPGGLLNLKVLEPVFNAMAELIHNKISKNVDVMSRRNDTVANNNNQVTASGNANPLLKFVNKFTAPTTMATTELKTKHNSPRTPVYIPVGSFGQDSAVGQNQNRRVLIENPQDNWYEKWKNIHAKNYNKVRTRDNSIAILEGGIPISPGQVITTNSDVIIGRPGESGPRPPTFALKNDIPIDMKPPPIPPAAILPTDGDHYVGQHSTNKGVNYHFAKDDLNKKPPLPIPPPKKHIHEGPNFKIPRPRPSERFKNGPPLKNVHSNKNTKYDMETMDLNPPPVPPPPIRPHDIHRPVSVNHKPKPEPVFDSPQNNRPIAIQLGESQNFENYVNPSEIDPSVLSLPALPSLNQIHHGSIPLINVPTPNVDVANPESVILIPGLGDLSDPNLVDRSTGHPFLVNIQPSQVANIVIPHGSSTALIVSGGKQHSLKGEVIDDPSPHPEPETVGFVGAEPVLKIENDDITPAPYNEIIPAETAEVSHTASHLNGLPLAGHLVKNPNFHRDQNSHFTQHYLSQFKNFTLASHQESGSSGKHHQLINQNHQDGGKLFVYQSHDSNGRDDLLSSQNINFKTQNSVAEHGEGQGVKNYRKEPFPNVYSNVKGSSESQKIYGYKQVQSNHGQKYPMGGDGLFTDHTRFNQGQILESSGGRIVAPPPEHLPGKPDINQLHENHSPDKQQSGLINHHLHHHHHHHHHRHQSGIVQDVSFPHGQSNSDKQKEVNPLKNILLNSNNQDSIPYDSQVGLKYSKNQNPVQRPADEFSEDLSPPPLPHRPVFVSNHQSSGSQKIPQKYRPHSNQPAIPTPLEFMIPPPETPGRVKLKPEPHSRPVIPIGALAPLQNFAKPRPEDMVIIPNKNRPGFVDSSFANNNNRPMPPIQNSYYLDLESSDTNTPLKTDDGQEIQESVSQPFFPGKVSSRPIHLHENSSNRFSNHHQNIKPLKPQATEEITQNYTLNVNVRKPDGVDSTGLTKPQIKKPGSDVLTNVSSEWSNNNRNPLGNKTVEAQVSNSGSGLFKHPSTHINVDSNSAQLYGLGTNKVQGVNYRQEYYDVANRKKPSGLLNHQGSSFESFKIQTGIKGSDSINSGSGKIPSPFAISRDNVSSVKITPLKPSMHASGFVTRRPPSSNANQNEFYVIGASQGQTAYATQNNGNKVEKDSSEYSSTQINGFLGTKNNTIDLTSKSNETEKEISGSPSHSNASGNRQPGKPPGRYGPPNHSNHVYRPGPQTIQNFKNFTRPLPGVGGQNGRPIKNSPASASGGSDRNKISVAYPTIINVPAYSIESNSHSRPFLSFDSIGQDSVEIKQPSGFKVSNSKNETNKVFSSSGSKEKPQLVANDIRLGSSESNRNKASTASGSPTSAFATKNETYHGNKTKNYYNSKPIFEVTNLHNNYNSVANEADSWFASTFNNYNYNESTASNKHPSAGSYQNTSSVLNPLVPNTSQVEMTLLTPPKPVNTGPGLEEVMGLSPPPLTPPRRPQRPQRPQRPLRPKPEYEFEIPSTTKPGHTPIAIENDFPPVRSPEFNKKPFKPQDIFPPRLPDNFVHHLPDYSGRLPPKTRLPEKPVTSLPIDLPTTDAVDKPARVTSSYVDDPFAAGTDINGHSKPIREEGVSSIKRQSSSITTSIKTKAVISTKSSTAYQEKSRDGARPESTSQQNKQSITKSLNRDDISPTPTVNVPIMKTHHTKMSSLVTPTITQPYETWQDADLIIGSETEFNQNQFSNRVTPTIKKVGQNYQTITTLISTGSTTIFGDLYLPKVSQAPENKFKTTAASGEKQNSVGKENNPKTLIAPAPTITPTRTTTLTVTTTMTTVLHSLGHKPLTKTIVFTKTLISTVFNKITETKTLVRPTTATFIQTHTIETTKTALVVPTAFYPTQTNHKPSGTLKPEIFFADPHAADTMTISVSSSLNKNNNREPVPSPGSGPLDQTDQESIMVVVSNEQSQEGGLNNNRIRVGDENDDDDDDEAKVFVGGVLGANSREEFQESNSGDECFPTCKAIRNESCQKLKGVMKCVCRPGFARLFPDRPCRPTYTYNVKLALEKLGSEQINYEKNVAQSNSASMAKLMSVTKEGLDRMIMQSELRDIYHGLVVNGFQNKEKKAMVDFYVQLSENTDEEKLMDIFKQTLQASNYSLGGTELYAAKETGNLNAEDFNECLNPKYHDCSEHARCFNLKGTYTCSCKEGYSDLSENSLFPGRICSDTIGCEYCGYHGACYPRGEGQITCECFQWYSGERCNINLKVLLIALVTIGAILLAFLLVCAVLTCMNKKSKGSSSSRNNGYLRYRGPSSRSIDRRAMISDSSSESSIDNIPYLSPPPPPGTAGTMNAKKKAALRHVKGPVPRTLPPPGIEQRDRSVTVMIPRAKYRPMPPHLSPHLTMSTFSPEKHLLKTAGQIATEQKLINYLDGNSREERSIENVKNQSSRQESEHHKAYDFKSFSSTMNVNDASRSVEKKKESRVFEYEYKISNMTFSEETNSADRRAERKCIDDRFRRHSDSTHLHSESNRNTQIRKYSAGALVSAGYEVSARVGMHQLDDDATEDDQSGILNTHTMKSNRSQFTTLNRTGDHKTMSEARSYDETTVHPQTRSLKTHYSGSSPSSRANNDEGHTMIERDLGSTFIMPESQLFKPEPDRGSDISNFDSL